MASFSPVRGTKTQITNTPIIDGQFLFETDQENESKIYADVIENNVLKRIVIGGGGHEMIPVVDTSVTPNVTDIEVIEELNNGNDHYVVNAYTVQRWSNCDVISLITHAAQGTNTIGLWEDGSAWKNYDPTVDDPTVYRAGWLWSADLYGILSDASIKDNIEITPIFDMANSEVVNLYAIRIDDNVPISGVNGGAVAFKFNGAIYSSSGVNVGLNLKYQRTNVKNFTVIS